MPVGLEIGFGAGRGRARVAAVKLAGRRLDDVAEQDQHRRRAERIDVGGVEVRLQDHVALVDRLPAGDRAAVEHEAVGQHVLVDHARGHGQMLPLALGIGEAEVDPVDLLVLDARKDRACVVRHDVVPALKIVWRPNECRAPAVSRATAARFELGTCKFPTGARRVRRRGEYFTRTKAPSGHGNCSARESFRRRSGTRRRVCDAFRSAVADRHSDPHHPAARAVHAPFLSSACIPAVKVLLLNSHQTR